MVAAARGMAGYK